MTLQHNQLQFRRATQQDLPQIIDLLSDDILGNGREDSQNIKIYEEAFLEISADKNNFLAVVELEKEIVGTCHLTLMPSLIMQGAKRLNIEAVRVKSTFRGQEIGHWMIEQTIEFAKNNQAKIIQLTTNKQRQDAQRFYQKLGFVASHEGMKLTLN
ncbi:MAG: GNAT family N-acetyltransferase [Rickettsiales bacterium]|nr:GNAT family N-acetyltransferase [Rickettsiales bacterium]